MKTLRLIPPVLPGLVASFFFVAAAGAATPPPPAPPPGAPPVASSPVPPPILAAGPVAAPPPPAGAPPAPPLPSAPPAGAPGLAGYGNPLPGATADELAAFSLGKADFLVVETVATGLGPIFNNVSCGACHSVPSTAGSSPLTVTRFGLNNGGAFDPLTALDGTLLHARAIAPVLQEVVPAQANVVAHRLTTPLYGAGLIEAIPDAAIVANAQLPKAPGVFGTVAYVTDEATGQVRVGRFGWKAQHATILSFVGDALNNEIGITNRIFPIQAAPDGNKALLAEFVSPTAPIKDQPDPATGLAEVDRLSNYLRFLAPPPPAPATPASIAGQAIFKSIGCASCHTPTLSTGPNASAALSNQTAALYSDLLIHSMGSLGDGIAQGAADTQQMRTSPLWGLRARAPYLHDGRAPTVDAAIRDHAGEGAASSVSYSLLSPAQQQQLLAFLATL